MKLHTAPRSIRTNRRAKTDAGRRTFPSLVAGPSRSSQPSVIEPAPADSTAPPPTSLLERYPTPSPVTVTHERCIVGETAEVLWEAYRANFEPLASLAVLQHFYTREEVLAEFANPSILKVVGWRDGAPVGLGMVTNVLEDVPQISPRFLREKYPDLAARNAIYFGILVMVVPGERGKTLFSRLYTEMWQVPALDGGILIFDVCDFNRLMFNADVLTQKIADHFPHSSLDVLDRQTYYVAHLPEPISGTGRQPNTQR